MKNLFTFSALLISLLAFFAGAFLLVASMVYPAFCLEWFYTLTASIAFFVLAFTLSMANHYEIYNNVVQWLKVRRAVYRANKAFARFNRESNGFRREAISRAERHTRRARQVALKNFGK